MYNSNNNLNDPMKMEVSEFKLNVDNAPKPFGFHIATINIPISAVLIKRVWKKRRKISKYVLKKSYKKKTNDKRGVKGIGGKVKDTEHIKKSNALDPKEFTGDRKWCWDEFERHIGVPKRIDIPPVVATTYVRLKSYQRFIPEAKNLRKPKHNDSVFLATDKPRSDCLCPDRECLCFGTAIIDERAKIPRNWGDPILKVCLTKLKGVCRRKTNIDEFIQKMIEATNASVEEEEETYKKVILRKELCLSRCIHSHVTGKLHDIKYTPVSIEVKQEEHKPKEEKKVEEPELEELPDDRICNVVYCTVSTQTDNASDGTLVMGHFSHLLYSNNQETFLKDIRGNQLQISHYTHVSPKPPDLRVCTNNMEKFLNFKDMKARLRNLISSIYVIKDPGTPVRTSETQIPLRRSETFKLRVPNRCGDEDFDNLKEVPWNFKMREAIIDEMRKYEAEKEPQDEVCPCCEYFADTAKNKKALLEDMRNLLFIDERDQLSESITIVEKIIREIVFNAVDDLYEKKKKKNLLSKLINARKASDEIMSKETDDNKKTDNNEKTDNDKKTVKCDFVRPKIPSILSSSKSVNEKISESVARRIQKRNEIIARKRQKKVESETNPEQNQDLPSNNEMTPTSSNEKSKNQKVQRVSFDKRNTSKDKIVLQVNTSQKKASSAFSSLFKWLFDPSALLSQIIKSSTEKSVSKDKLSTDILSTDILSTDKLSTDILSTDKLSTDTNLNREEKSSEREVFSIRYTTSAISADNSTSFENDK